MHPRSKAGAGLSTGFADGENTRAIFMLHVTAEVYPAQRVNTQGRFSCKAGDLPHGGLALKVSLEPRVGILHQKFVPPICSKKRPEPKALDATSRPVRTAGNGQSAECGRRFFSSLRRVYCGGSPLGGRLRTENRSPWKTGTKSRIRRSR